MKTTARALGFSEDNEKESLNRGRGRKGCQKTLSVLYTLPAGNKCDASIQTKDIQRTRRRATGMQGEKSHAKRNDNFEY